MAENNTDNVSVSKPKTGGAVFYVPYGTAGAPVDAVSELDGYTCVGYISEDGLTEGTDSDTEDIKAWGGDIVLRTQTSYGKTYSFTLLETSPDVMRLLWGEDAVEEFEDTFTVTHTSAQHGNITLVIDMVLNDGKIKRSVVEKAQVTEVSDITYTHSDAIGYEVTISSLPVNGDVHAKDYYAYSTDDEDGD